MAVPLEAFREGHDVYIDYPFEDAMFRYEHKTGKVFRKFYGEAEVEIEHSSELFHDAIRSSGGGGGRLISAEQYAQGKPAGQRS
ncbi:MAG: hypothetical protein ACE145_15325 [Terriglobia bacterium]